MLYAILYVLSIAFAITCVMSTPYMFRWGMKYFRSQEEKKQRRNN